MKRKNIKYVHPRFAGDFVGILDLQTLVHRDTLLREEQRERGFLEVVLTANAVTAISKINLIKIAFSTRTAAVIGMVAGVPFSIANRIGFLHQYVPEISVHFDYACFGQLCVLHRKTKFGIGTQLLQQLEHLAAKNGFKAVIFPISHGNVVGSEFLYKREYTPLHAPLVTGVVLYHKAI